MVDNETGVKSFWSVACYIDIECTPGVVKCKLRNLSPNFTGNGEFLHRMLFALLKQKTRTSVEHFILN